jgi:hypothetical protein
MFGCELGMKMKEEVVTYFEEILATVFAYGTKEICSNVSPNNCVPSKYIN